MLTEAQKNKAEKRLADYLLEHYGADIKSASDKQLFYALANISKEYLYQSKGKFNAHAKNPKAIHYMSIEFLIGKTLRNNLWNLELEETYKNLLREYNRDIEDVYSIEKDAGLGNGGLGRLASCYLDSLARLGYKGFGHCIKYEYGLFKQAIVNGKQEETPDEWLDTGKVWLDPREDLAVEVLFGGTVKQDYINDRVTYVTEKAEVIKALPYDMLISGYDSNSVVTLRLWEAKAINSFDIDKFEEGYYSDSMKKIDETGSINKLLYPSDKTDKGRRLRLLQEYFLVSAAMQNILNEYFEKNKTLDKLPDLVSVHINDTHPALCVPELMRLLLDKYEFGWDESWAAVSKVISYTNHTILSEALEVQQLNQIEKVMPRIAMILKELDRRFRMELEKHCNGDFRKVESMAIISGNNVYMANLSIYASHSVNGVSKIHTHILKTRLFNAYAEIYPNRFKNITNGITHRRWLSQINPGINNLIVSLIGKDYYKNPNELRKLLDYTEDKEVLERVHQVKLENKKALAKYLKETQNVDINPEWRFIVQAKRIHEYKRQLLNVMRIIYLCNKIHEDPNAKVTPQVFFFAGKAASGYDMAKRIIQLINCVAEEIENDPVLRSKIQVVFIENYSVTVSEILMPATEVTEQISLAGREASGTGNMKAVLNGALMMCTSDGANIEISDECSHENAFEFGLTADEVDKIKSRGYNATEYYIDSERVRSVLDKMSGTIGGESFNDLVSYLLGHSNYKDSYMCLADFDAYIDAYEKMDRIYSDKEFWNKKVLHCISSMGQFSSDRAIKEYVDKIWHLTKD